MGQDQSTQRTSRVEPDQPPNNLEDTVSISIKAARHISTHKLLTITVNKEIVASSLIRNNLAAALLPPTNTIQNHRANNLEVTKKLQHLRSIITNKDRTIGLLEQRILDLETSLDSSLDSSQTATK